jgi:hypothetical protein
MMVSLEIIYFNIYTKMGGSGSKHHAAAPQKHYPNLPVGNWTPYLKTALSTHADEANFIIGRDGGGTTDPARGCQKEFSATYQCGTGQAKSINIPKEAWGKSAHFDCTEENKLCIGFKLTLGDDGNLVLTDGKNERIWSSDTSATGLSLDEFKATKGKYKRNYLTSGEYLDAGEFIGSPSGNCYLTMVASSGALELRYNVLNCTKSPGAYGQASTANALYSITNKLNGKPSLGKVGYINDDGKLRAYPDSMVSDSSDFRYIGKYVQDGGVVASNGNLPNITLDQCKAKCNSHEKEDYDAKVAARAAKRRAEFQSHKDKEATDLEEAAVAMTVPFGFVGAAVFSAEAGVQADRANQVNAKYAAMSPPVGEKCGGFQYYDGKGSSGLGTSSCQLLGPGTFPQKGRISAESDLYIRKKQVTNSDTCPKEVEAGTAENWAAFPHAANMAPSSLCQLGFATEQQRQVADETNDALVKATATIKDGLSSLTSEEKGLVEKLGYNVDKLQKDMDSYDQATEAKGRAEKALFQVGAMRDDTDLNMVSQNYQYILWTILAILVVIGSIKATRH